MTDSTAAVDGDDVDGGGETIAAAADATEEEAEERAVSMVDLVDASSCSFKRMSP